MSEPGWHGLKGYTVEELRELSDEQLAVVVGRIIVVQEERERQAHGDGWKRRHEIRQLAKEFSERTTADYE